MFAQYNYASIKIPLFPIQSLYDSWSLPNILGIGCGAAGSFANCNNTLMEYIDSYRQNTSLIMGLIGNNSKNGGWAPACSDHVYSYGGAYYSSNYRVPASSQFSVNYCVNQWH